MKKSNKVRIISYIAILIALLSFAWMQFDQDMTSVNYAATIEDMTNYEMVFRDFDASYTIYDAYVVIVKANFSDFVDDNIYDLLSLTYAKEGWQEADKNINVEQVRVLIAMKGGWMNRFTEKGIRDKTAIKPSYYLIYKWPDNDGFVEETEETITLEVGKKIDRYGYPGGFYLSPVGLAYKERALTPGTKETKPYFIYEVKEPIVVKAGRIQPWFGVGTGTGLQYYLNGKSVQDYLDSGALVIVPQ
jgi:hypothetical protein